MQQGKSINGLWAVVLAAGESRRLGRPKQLVQWRGESLITRSVRAAQVVCGQRVVVVLGAHRDAIECELKPLSPVLALNPHWTEGLASSLRAGIAALPPSCEAALLQSCDQPRVPVRALQALAQCWRENPDHAIASAYANTVGIPAILPTRLFTTLKALSGDKGARVVLRAEGAQLLRLSLPEAAFDVDDEDSLRALEASDEPARTGQ
jgi:molybdenum cofactor cytidylyltransferase